MKVSIEGELVCSHKPDRFRKSVEMAILLALIVAFLSGFSISSSAGDGPDIQRIKNGDVQVQRNGDELLVEAPNGSIIEYNQFDIPKDFTVQFDQPSAAARVLNRDLSGTASQINGNLFANGQVYLTNPAGIGIGPAASIDVGRFIAAAGRISDEDFLAGKDLFTDLEGGVINEGNLEANGVHLLGERIANYGKILVPDGTVTMSSGKEVYLGKATGKSFVKIKRPGSDSKKEGTGINNEGTVKAEGGTVRMAAGDLFSTAVDIDGLISAERSDGEGGRVEIKSSSGTVRQEGEIRASGSDRGGSVKIDAEHLTLGYGSSIDVSGDTGGRIDVTAGTAYHENTLRAAGNAGNGGTVTLDIGPDYTATSAAKVDVSGETGGRIALTTDGRAAISGTFVAVGRNGKGGHIEFGGPGGIGLLSATLDASGTNGGGRIRLGGPKKSAGINSELTTARATVVSQGSSLLAETTGTNGPGGEIVIWGDDSTEFYGEANVRPGTDAGTGGFIELSSDGSLEFTGEDNLLTGREKRPGELLIDPKNITITDTPEGRSLALKIADGTSLSEGGTLSLSDFDSFGDNGAALNGAGDIFAVGAIGDDTGGKTRGATYIFGLDTSNLSADPTLHKKIAHGTSLAGGGTLSLSDGDAFGRSTAINGGGDILAVGAFEDDAGGTDRGSAYVLGLDPGNLSGAPTLHRKITDGTSLAGGGTLSIDDSDDFGSAIALNDAGQILTIGSKGVGLGGNNSGAVYVFGLNTNDLSADPTLHRKIENGTSLAGGETLKLDPEGSFGFNASINGTGNILAITAPFDDTDDVIRAGATFIFGLDPNSLSKDPRLHKKITHGTPLTGGGTLSLTEEDDFGSSVGMNGAGDVLAVGATGDDTGEDIVGNVGAAYVFNLDTNNLSSDPTLKKKFADGASLPGGETLSLSDGNRFGSSMALNNDGDILAVGADGEGRGLGAAYLFSSRETTARDPGRTDFGIEPSAEFTLLASDVVSQLDGSNLTLQANNDITVETAIDATGNAGGGDLTLSAGRSIFINADVVLRGDFSSTANASGADASHRDSGEAVISMADGKVIDTSTTDGTLDLSLGSGPTGSESAGAISVADLDAGEGNVTLNSAGAIDGTSNDGTADITGSKIELVAESGGIGQETALEVEAGESLDADTTSDGASITVESVTDLPVGLVTTGSSTSGTVTLDSTGNVTDADGGDTIPSSVDVIASSLDVTAATGIGDSDGTASPDERLETAVSTLAANSSDSSIELMNDGDLAVVDATATGTPGDILLSAASSIDVGGAGMDASGDVVATADENVTATSNVTADRDIILRADNDGSGSGDFVHVDGTISADDDTDDAGGILVSAHNITLDDDTDATAAGGVTSAGTVANADEPPRGAGDDDTAIGLLASKNVEINEDVVADGSNGNEHIVVNADANLSDLDDNWPAPIAGIADGPVPDEKGDVMVKAGQEGTAGDNGLSITSGGATQFSGVNLEFDDTVSNPITVTANGSVDRNDNGDNYHEPGSVTLFSSENITIDSDRIINANGGNLLIEDSFEFTSVKNRPDLGITGVTREESDGGTELQESLPALFYGDFDAVFFVEGFFSIYMVREPRINYEFTPEPETSDSELE